MPPIPPTRTRLSELGIATLVFIGALSVSVIAGLCVSVALIALFQISEGSAFLFLPAFFICTGLLVDPAIFAAVLSNHCRRVSPYLIVPTVAPWLIDFVLLSRRDPALRGELAAVVAVTTLAGLAAAQGILRRKSRKLRDFEAHPPQ
jgi:hypothetical protein